MPSVSTMKSWWIMTDLTNFLRRRLFPWWYSWETFLWWICSKISNFYCSFLKINGKIAIFHHIVTVSITFALKRFSCLLYKSFESSELILPIIHSWLNLSHLQWKKLLVKLVEEMLNKDTSRYSVSQLFNNFPTDLSLLLQFSQKTLAIGLHFSMTTFKY